MEDDDALDFETPFSQMNAWTIITAYFEEHGLVRQQCVPWWPSPMPAHPSLSPPSRPTPCPAVLLPPLPLTPPPTPLPP